MLKLICCLHASTCACTRAHAPALYPSHSQCWETSMKQLLSYTVETQYAGFHAHQKFRGFKDLWECFPVRHHESLRRARLPGNWHPSCWKQPFLGIPLCSRRGAGAMGNAAPVLAIPLLHTHTRAYAHTQTHTERLLAWDSEKSHSVSPCGS